MKLQISLQIRISIRINITLDHEPLKEHVFVENWSNYGMHLSILSSQKTCFVIMGITIFDYSFYLHIKLRVPTQWVNWKRS